MDRLLSEPGLRRKKWDERHFADGSTYGEKTIERAIAGTDEFYESSGRAADRTDCEPSTDRGGRTGRQRPRDRGSARVERLETLEAGLRETIDEAERLRVELKNRTRSAT